MWTISIVRTIFFMTSFWLPATFAIATEQIPDQLLYNNSTYYIDGFFLSKELQKKVSEYKKQKIIKCSTANWDCFWATLTIKNNKLYLLDVKFEIRKTAPQKYQDNPESLRFDIPGEGYFAKWYSGKLYGLTLDSDDTYHAYNYTHIFEVKEGVLLK